MSAKSWRKKQTNAFNWNCLSISNIFLLFSDPADALQKDSPYYEIEPLKNGKKGSDYEKTHSLVKKHHITQIEKEGKKRSKLPKL